MPVHKKIPAGKRLSKGKGEEGLARQAEVNSEDAKREQFDGGQKESVANPLSTIAKASGSRKADVAAPLYFPGARSSALRSHSGVKFMVFRVDSPEDVSDPIPIIFKLKLDLSKPTLRTSNPAHASQKLSRKYYALEDVDVDLWDHDGTFGISLVERKTKCLCMHSGIERDYVFADERERDRFCCLIYAVDDGVLPAGAVRGATYEMTPQADVAPIKLFVSTWNQGDTEPAANIGDDWLPTDGSVDLFVIGTQESPLQNALGVSAGTSPSAKWFKTLQDTVGDEYVAVATRSMYQNHLWVATKREHAGKFSHVETYQAEQGIGKIWGNKGGTAVALRFNGYRLAFVNTHLAAHAEKWERRNEDIGNIVQEVHFGDYQQVEFNTQYSTWWLGDMNYRVEMDREEAAALCDADKCSELFPKEQLKREMAKGLLDGFVEGELTFRPTYKLDPREPDAETVSEPRKFSDYKDRCPSWTDRVLMRPMPGVDLKITGYDSAWKVTSSDHDPVFSTFEFKAPEKPLSGNYRRFVLEIGMLEVSEMSTPGTTEMLATFNFPFLDDIKKGVKFKHSIPMVASGQGSDGKTKFVVRLLYACHQEPLFLLLLLLLPRPPPRSVSERF